MKQSFNYKKCVVCGALGVPLIWNNINIFNCNSCGLAWRTSFDIPADYYAKLNIGRLKPGKRKTISRLRNAEDRLTSVMRFLPKSDICDIGCGDGSFLSILKEKGYTNCFGIEPSSYNYEIALKNQLEIIKGDIASVRQEVKKRKIKAITLFHVIEHIYFPIETLQNIKNILKPGGILIIETPDSNASIQKVTNHRNPLICREHLFYWNEKSLRIILKKLGFKILIIKHRSFDWENASIKLSLIRLGFLSNFFVSLRHQGENISQETESINNKKRLHNNFFRNFMRYALAHLVHILGKDDYIFIMAKRE